MAGGEETVKRVEEPAPNETAVIGSVPLVHARLSPMDQIMDQFLEDSGVVSGPFGTIRRVGRTGIQVVGLDTGEQAGDQSQKLL